MLFRSIKNNETEHLSIDDDEEEKINEISEKESREFEVIIENNETTREKMVEEEVIEAEKEAEEVEKEAIKEQKEESMNDQKLLKEMLLFASKSDRLKENMTIAETMNTTTSNTTISNATISNATISNATSSSPSTTMMASVSLPTLGNQVQKEVFEEDHSIETLTVLVKRLERKCKAKTTLASIAMNKLELLTKQVQMETNQSTRLEKRSRMQLLIARESENNFKQIESQWDSSSNGQVAHKRGAVSIGSSNDVNVDVQSKTNGKWSPASRYDAPYMKAMSNKNVEHAAKEYAKAYALVEKLEKEESNEQQIQAESKVRMKRMSISSDDKDGINEMKAVIDFRRSSERCITLHSKLIVAKKSMNEQFKLMKKYEKKEGLSYMKQYNREDEYLTIQEKTRQSHLYYAKAQEIYQRMSIAASTSFVEEPNNKGTRNENIIWKNETHTLESIKNKVKYWKTEYINNLNLLKLKSKSVYQSLK